MFNTKHYVAKVHDLI